MPIILYTETNFLLSYATGRDTTTDRLLTGPPSSIRTIMLCICFMEALSVLEGERKRQRDFVVGLESQIVQAQRNVISPNIQSFINHLQGSLVEFQRLSSDLETRLFQAIVTLSDRAIMIEPTATIIRSSFASGVISDPTDNLILSSILSHALAHGSDTKAFVTENRKCFFDNPFAKAALQSAGIKCFSDASKCLEWLDSLPASEDLSGSGDRDDPQGVEV